MKTLEQIKKEKNFLANVKGYPMDPEGFPKYHLINRIWDEFKELNDAIDRELFTSKEALDDAVMDELADISNFIDFLATKIVVNYPDRYDPEEVEG